MRAFLSAFFGTIGFLAALILIIIGLGALYSFTEEETYGSGVKLLPDEDGKRKRLSMEVPVILEIPVKGTVGIDGLTGAKIEDLLLKSREKRFKDGRVKGILLHINSPGGGVNASDQIYRLIQEYKKQYNVPVYAFIDGLCASGGYYIACASDKIYASSVSLVGSVGVLSWPPFVNVSEVMKKIGVEALTVIAGKGKDAMNPFRPWNEDEEATYQQLIDHFYKEFVDIVIAARPSISKNHLIEEYGAGVFPAPKAQNDGFIDAAGVSRKEVLKDLRLAAGIKEGEKYQVVAFPHKSYLEKIFQSSSPLLTGKIKHCLELPENWQCHEGIPFSYIYR